MIRAFALVVLDNRDKELERFTLDLVSDPKGMGFVVDITTIETDIEEIPVFLKQKLGSITFDINYGRGYAYEKASTLRRWIEKNTNKRMVVEWATSVGTYFADCKVEKFEFSEINQQNILSIPLSVRQLSPFFEVVEQAINIYPSESGKEYDFIYPYTYGAGVVSDNEIANNYIKPIPLIITLYGEMTDPSVTITDTATGEIYGRVMFSGLSLLAGQWLTINAVTRKITYFNGVNETDGYMYLNMAYQSFIFARENAISSLDAPSVQSDKSGKLEASFRRYRL